MAMGRAVLLAVLLVLALPLGVAGAPTGDQAETAGGPGDVAILTLNGTSRASFATPTVDVGTALAVQRDAGAAQLERYALDERFQNTDGTEARQTLLFESATAVEIRIAALRDQERAIRTAYANREVDTETYVRQLAVLGARVGELRATLDRIQAHADDIPEFSIRRRVQLLDAALYGFEGPVRARVRATMRGDAPPTRLFVSVSGSGVVLSTIENGRHVREAYRADHRDTETVGGMTLNEAAERSEILYPDAYNTSTSIRTGIIGLSGGLYRLDIELRQGVVTAYLDGATRNVFFESQGRRLDLLDPRPAVVGSDNGTRLVVNRTYPGGPLRVTVTANATGQPRQVPVVVQGTRLETGDDGTLWTLGPAAPYQVTAVGPQGNVTVSVRPLEPTPVAAEG